jgi:hypothetical protein
MLAEYLHIEPPRYVVRQDGTEAQSCALHATLRSASSCGEGAALVCTLKHMLGEAYRNHERSSVAAINE